MLASKIRMIFGLAPVVSLLSGCAAPGPAGVSATAPSRSAAVVVTGSMPGYTDRDLARMVSSCVASPTLSRTTDKQDRPNWQIRIHFESVYTPYANILVTAELLNGRRFDAVRWNQTRGLASAPPVETCQIVSNLTQQLWKDSSRSS
jgi:hypothetical protein